MPSPAPRSSCVAGLGSGYTAEEEAQPRPSWGTLSPSQVPGNCSAWYITDGSWMGYLRLGPANRGPPMRHLTNKVWEGRRALWRLWAGRWGVWRGRTGHPWPSLWEPAYVGGRVLLLLPLHPSTQAHFPCKGRPLLPHRVNRASISAFKPQTSISPQTSLGLGCGFSKQFGSSSSWARRPGPFPSGGEQALHSQVRRLRAILFAQHRAALAEEIHEV